MNKNDLPRLTGFTLIEILIVTAIFSVLMVIVSQVSLTTFQNIRRTDVQTGTRNEISNALAFVERQVRNAKLITYCSGPGASSPRLDVLNEFEETISYRCYIYPRTLTGRLYTQGQDTRSNASDNEHTQLTSDEVYVSACEFVCDPGSLGIPPSVDITITGQSKYFGNTDEVDQITLSTGIQLRTY